MVRIARAAVVRGRTDTAVQHNVRSHASAEILQRGKASTSHRRAFARNTLDALEALQIQTVVVAVSNDQIRLVGATDELHSNRVHVLLDVGGRHGSATIGDTRVGHRTPEAPRCAVDAAVGAGRRRIRNRSSQTRQVLAAVARAVAVQVTADAVGKLGLSHVHTAIEQVDDRFLARVLDHLQTRDGHRRSVLRDAELSSRDGAVLRNVQHFIAAIAIGVVRGRVVVHDFFKDHVTARERLDVSALLETTKQRIVVRHVVSEFTTAALDVSRNNVAD